jgi:AraC family transcriptional regulator, regulatory protein of adaptative response / DNA-3-methyladenine glycosylase II
VTAPITPRRRDETPEDQDGLPPEEVCDRARLARDRRFDGRFFTGVRTTGIYCRPVCPVVPARSRNVRFFISAPAAELAGFRPCLRCRPETAPGSPAWRGSGATVSRALALINRGLLDERRLPDFAAAVGVGARHLTRLFVKHCGAPPGVLARCRRLQTAKRLLDETDLSMTQVAFASGFASLRRFNGAFLETYGWPPSRLRRRPHPRGAGDVISLRLHFRPPYDWPLTLGLLTLEAVPGVERVAGVEYCRTLSVGEATGWLAVAPLRGEHALSLSLWLPDHSGLGAVIARAQAMLDMSADPARIEAAMTACLRAGVAAGRLSGLRLPGAWDGFEIALRAMIERDVGRERTGGVMSTLVARLGRPVTFASRPELTRVFPAPRRFAKVSLRSCGLSAQGERGVHRLARAVAENRIRFDGSMAFGALAAALVAAGLDRAAAEWVGMRSVAEPDADLADRLPLNSAQRAWWRIPATQTTLRPWRSYAALLLWLSSRSRGGASRGSRAGRG